MIRVLTFPYSGHNSYISSLFNFDDLTQEHIEVKLGLILSTLFVFMASMSEIFNFQLFFFVFAFFLFAGSYQCCISSGLL